MIKKEIKLTLKIQKLQSLLRRLPNNHPRRQEIQEELAKRLAGLKGEQSLDYYLSFLPPQDYYILHNLRLPNAKGPHFFQLDVLLLTPSFMLIIEVKNISGTLTFDPAFDQVIWTNLKTGIEKAIQDPVMQVKHQQYQLVEWLAHKKLPVIPVETIVVLTNSSTILKIISNKNDYINSIIRSTRLLAKIDQFKNKHPNEQITTKEMNKISTHLLKQHTPECPDYLKWYNVENPEILSGVYCENCSSLPMRYQWGKWVCPNCSFTSKEAHIKALEDYSLLIDPSISNHQLKNFLLLPTSATTYHILQSMNLQHSGGFKGRKYHLPPVEID